MSNQSKKGKAKTSTVKTDPVKEAKNKFKNALIEHIRYGSSEAPKDSEGKTIKAMPISAVCRDLLEYIIESYVRDTIVLEPVSNTITDHTGYYCEVCEDVSKILVLFVNYVRHISANNLVSLFMKDEIYKIFATIRSLICECRRKLLCTSKFEDVDIVYILETYYNRSELVCVHDKLNELRYMKKLESDRKKQENAKKREQLRQDTNAEDLVPDQDNDTGDLAPEQDNQNTTNEDAGSDPSIQS